jgi:hypothetical protein
MGVGFSSYFQLGTDYEKLTTTDMVLLSTATALITSIMNLLLKALLRDDPTSINTKSAGERSHVVDSSFTVSKGRIVFGGLATIAATGTAYYCIIAISLQSSPEALSAWLRMVIYSLIQDQIIMQLAQLGAKLLIIHYLIANPHIRMREIILKYVIDRKLTQLFEFHLLQPKPNANPARAIIV